MRLSSSIRVLFLVLCLKLVSVAQVASVSSVKDPQSQLLQQQYYPQLEKMAQDAAAAASHFPYPFYFSQNLDIDEAKQKQLPQGSVHFERYNGEVLLEITGNYYISYATKALTPNRRAHHTFDDVVLPLLKVTVARMDRSVPFDAFGFEIAYHVRSMVQKIVTEGAENLVLVIPRSVGERLAAATDLEGRQGALLDSDVFLNGQPLTLWLSGDEAPLDVKNHYLARRRGEKPLDIQSADPEPGSLVSSSLIPESELAKKIRERASAPPDLSPLRMEKLQTQYDPAIQRLVTELGPQAHFVDYAPPAFVSFHAGAYLQLSISTNLEQPAGSSQYRIAALAFDTHVSHLLRPVNRYFHDNPKFDGVDFSTTIRQSAQPSSESVEFVVPFAALACYEKYDCTGQELINRSLVLINGERVSLDLQKAENGFNAGVR
ncbi:MAG TPA: hypothetical protein VIX19_03130 [Terriglobales bacterium]